MWLLFGICWGPAILIAIAVWVETGRKKKKGKKK